MRLVMSSRLVRCSAILLMAMLATFALDANPATAQGVAQTYYVPLTDAAELSQFMGVLEGRPVTRVETVVSIVASGEGTIVWFDHWEDGYEGSESSQPSTQVWGDGNPANGIPPGFATDHLRAGSVITLRNSIPIPRPSGFVAFDGRDKINASRAVAVTRAAWSDAGPVIAEAVEVYDTRSWGTRLVAPVGQDANNDLNMFQETWLVVMAKEATTVQLQRFGGGTQTVALGEGQSVAFEDIDVADAVTATAPVQGQLMVGERADSGGSLEMRWFALYPDGAWSHSYYSPVGRSSVSGDRTSVWLYNDDDAAPLQVNWETTTGPGLPAVAVGPKESVRFDIPGITGVHLWSQAGEPFLAVSTVNSANDGGEPDNDTWDWGFALIPEDQLTTQALVGWGPGNSNVPPSTADNGSPVWVTPTAETTVYWDFDGDPTTGTQTHLAGPLVGQKYDGSAVVAKLASRKIFDGSDRDQTGMRVYSLDGTPLAVAWGEDPSEAGPSNPYLDAGTAVRPLPDYSVSKSAKAVNHLGEDDPDGLVNPGDFILYTITITSEGSGAVLNVVLQDELPAHVQYVEGTTRKGADPVPDDSSPQSPFPLDESGLALGTLPAMGEIVVTFRVQVDVVNPTFPETHVVNGVQVTSSNAGDQDAEVETPVVDPQISLEKTVYKGSGTGECPGVENVLGLSGTAVVYCFKIVNTGNTHLSSVTLTDADLGVNKLFEGVLGPFGAGEAYWAQADTITADLVNEGQVTGTPSSPSGTPIPGADDVEATDTASVTLAIPSILLSKKTNGGDGLVIAAGTAITWSYDVTNDGNVTLTNVTVIDDKLAPAAINCGAGSNVIASLAAGATATCTAVGTAVAGAYSNIGTVVGTPPEGAGGPVTATDPSSYFGSNPSIQVVKTTNGGDGLNIPVGAAVTWMYVVTNTGNVALTGVAVTDNKLAPAAINCGAGSNVIASLAAGATATCTAVGTAVAGAYANVGTATGTPPVGGPVTGTDPSSYFGASPLMAVKKYVSVDEQATWHDADAAPGPEATVGSNVYCKFVVSNPGNVPLTGVTLADSDVAFNALIPSQCAANPTTLPPGGSFECVVGPVPAEEGQHENVATATGLSPVGAVGPVTDPAHYLGNAADGCTRTQGYWSTHSIYGPAPYDETWAEIGEDTLFFLSGQSWIQVIKAPTKGNPYYILAQQYIAARLNVLSGTAATPVATALAQAEGLFGAYTPGQAASLKKNEKQVWIDLASILDRYNNGLLGVPHCD